MYYIRNAYDRNSSFSRSNRFTLANFPERENTKAPVDSKIVFFEAKLPQMNKLTVLQGPMDKTHTLFYELAFG